MKITVPEDHKRKFFASVGESERRNDPQSRSSGGKKMAPRKPRAPRPHF